MAPEGSTPKESVEIFKRMTDVLARKQQDTGMKLLWGTANLFSHRRFMCGAATNPNPEVFALAALQVKEAMEATQKLGGKICHRSFVAPWQNSDCAAGWTEFSARRLDRKSVV